MFVYKLQTQVPIQYTDLHISVRKILSKRPHNPAPDLQEPLTWSTLVPAGLHKNAAVYCFIAKCKIHNTAFLLGVITNK